MKGRIAVLAVAAALAAASLPAALLLPRQGAAQGKGAPSGAVSVSRAADAYIVGVYQGRVAIFGPSGQSGTPREVLDVYVDTLPPSEQQRLQKGIRVEGLEQLLSLEESFTT